MLFHGFMPADTGRTRSILQIDPGLVLLRILPRVRSLDGEGPPSIGMTVLCFHLREPGSLDQ